MNFVWAGLLKTRSHGLETTEMLSGGGIAETMDYYAVITNALKECLMTQEDVCNARHLKMWATK